MNHLRGVGPVPTPLGNIHCTLINPPKIVSGARKQVHVTEWEGTPRNCGGDREFWLRTLPVSCRLEICAGRWSLQLALCCCQRNEHVRPSLPGWDPTQIMTQSNWVCLFFFMVVENWNITTCLWVSIQWKIHRLNQLLREHFKHCYIFLITQNCDFFFLKPLPLGRFGGGLK